MASIQTLTDIKRIRWHWLSQAKSSYYIDQVAQDKLNNIMLSTVGQVFVTMFDFQKYEFVELENVDKYLGYNKEEFTIKTLNNDSALSLHLTHPDDIVHTRRYNTIIYQLMARPPEGFQIKVLADNYEVIFRVRHKKGHYLRIRRKCYLMPLQNGRPTAHIDTWEILQNDFEKHVVTRFQTRNKAMNKAITERFYKLNCKELGFHLTPRESQIIKHKMDGKLDKEVAAILGLATRTVQTRIGELKKRANDFLFDLRSTQDIVTTYELLQFVKCYGLFPNPALRN